MRVLLVEDDDEVAVPLVDALSRRGVSVERARDVGEAEAYLAAIDYAAVLLDLGLPDEDGIALLTRMRARGDTRPVLVLSARGAIDARIRGLNEGADEYMVKPFDVDELHARLLAILRRRDGYTGKSLRCGALEFIVETRVAYIDAQPLALSVRETQLLELLLRRCGKVVPKTVVEDQLFGLDSDLGSNAVEVYIHRLRKKLEDGSSCARIETVRGVGYMMVAAA
ncbi:MAG: response regulator [Sphingomonas sp.]|jgi:DNA-binding response OmpR family regulator|nr:MULTISPECIES: response regulator transcription factor [unclassified Sphingomonas]MDR6850234.1 two-component system response regulator TctD [Sphingomonas sp. BE137]MDR7257168.1 two-component system response regulator TctD [Sphingomonas sp. BE270]